MEFIIGQLIEFLKRFIPWIGLNCCATVLIILVSLFLRPRTNKKNNKSNLLDEYHQEFFALSLCLTVSASYDLLVEFLANNGSFEHIICVVLLLIVVMVMTVITVLSRSFDLKPTSERVRKSDDDSIVLHTSEGLEILVAEQQSTDETESRGLKAILNVPDFDKSTFNFVVINNLRDIKYRRILLIVCILSPIISKLIIICTQLRIEQLLQTGG